MTRGSPPEAADFLRFYTGTEVQREAAQRGFTIPAAKGTAEQLQNAFFRQVATICSRPTTCRTSTTRCLAHRSGAW
ncbi:hypothetical protein ACFQU7_26545 [Pseudoroseomonas wenyumeiae]